MPEEKIPKANFCKHNTMKNISLFVQYIILSYTLKNEGYFMILKEPSGLLGDATFLEQILLQTILQNPIYHDITLLLFHVISARVTWLLIIQTSLQNPIYHDISVAITQYTMTYECCYSMR